MPERYEITWLYDHLHKGTSNEHRWPWSIVHTCAYWGVLIYIPCIGFIAVIVWHKIYFGSFLTSILNTFCNKKMKTLFKIIQSDFKLVTRIYNLIYEVWIDIDQTILCSGGQRNFITGGCCLAAACMLGSGVCFHAPSQVPYSFLVRVESKIHILQIACWLQLKYYLRVMQ